MTDPNQPTQPIQPAAAGQTAPPQTAPQTTPEQATTPMPAVVNLAPSAGAPVPPPTAVPPTAASPAQPPAPQSAKKTSKLAVFAIIVAVLFLLSAFMGVKTWSMLVGFTVLPALLSGFAVYVTRKDGRRQGSILAYVAVGITVVALIVGGVGVVREGARQKAADEALAEASKVECKDISWPQSDLANQLPKPESSTGEIETDSSNVFSVSVCDTTKAQYDAYVTAVQGKGFTVDYSKGDDTFTAKNEAGYSVHVSVNQDNKNVMDVSIRVPEQSSATEGSDQSGDTSSSEGSTDQGATNDSGQSGQQDSGTTTNGIRPEFKDAMDSYESLMNEYADFMDKYDSAGKPASMAADYAKILIKYNDAMKKLDAIDESTLSDEELQYYTEVVGRVNQRLASVSQ
ncbi:permease [Bifidobacterium sp. CP2]|uniref:DUF6591 domain-containing protein n=1 Tax=Bifidobacterium sp. CP2 TaxID=2809025 RepID=UPI001BDCAA15|nr:DUF6591 domain-containing protein [Bifidobacterium sp. CP2]MBT1181897.1 permease [Bifidobacterium sp. CP2]